MTKLQTLMEVDALVRENATYVPDAKLRDSWDSFADVVMKGGRFKGDCDDWAMTSLDILHRYYDFPRETLYRALVSTTGTEIDHMIGIVEIDGVRWTVGDTFGPPRLVTDADDIRQTSRMDERRNSLPVWRFWGKSKLQRTTTSAAMGLKISQKGIDFIKGYEAFYARVYDDFQPARVLTSETKIRGTLTIGYGHTGRDVRVGMPNWTEAQASRQLDIDLDTYEAAVRRLVRVVITQDQFDALVSFCFNCGETNLAGSTLLKKINSRAPVNEIQVQFRRWNRSKGVVMRGLVRRRDAEAAIWAGYTVTSNAAPTAADPDVSPSPLVEETKDASKSATLWLTGLVAACPMIVEATRSLREVGIEVEMPFIVNSTGIFMIVASGVVFGKRMYEIVVAARR